MKLLLALLLAQSLTHEGAKFPNIPVHVPICPAGLNAVNVCVTYSNLGASYTNAGNGVQIFVDLSVFRQFRITAFMAAAAVTGDIEIQCDADSTFGSAAVLGQLTNPGANGNVGSWTELPANECATAGGVWLRVGMINGDGAEDPSIRRATLELR